MLDFCYTLLESLYYQAEQNGSLVNYPITFLFSLVELYDFIHNIVYIRY